MAKKLRKRKKIETFDIVNVCVLTLLMLIVLIPFCLLYTSPSPRD